MARGMLAQRKGAKPDAEDPEDAAAPQGDGGADEGEEQDGEETGADQDSDETGEQPNASPEEQDAYNQFVANGLKLIYDRTRVKAIMQSVAGAGDFVHGLAVTTAHIIFRLVSSAKQQGQDISGDVVLHGGAEILQDLAQLAGKFGLHRYSTKEIQAAMLQCADIVTQMLKQAGLIDPQAMQQDLATLKQADDQGQLDQVLPGASDMAKSAPAQPPQAPPQPGQEA